MKQGIVQSATCPDYSLSIGNMC